MSAIMEFSILPLDKTMAISHCIARVVALIRESGLPCTFGPISGSVEGEWDELMALAGRCFHLCAQESRHLHINMRVLWRADQENRLATMGMYATNGGA